MNPVSRKQPDRSASTRCLEVVVADDVAEITELMSHWLEAEGHTVTRASNGREVIELWQKRAYDLLVTDIVMPGIDGWDAILAVSRLRPETRILAISGGGKEMPADGCLRVAQGVGADHVLKKPFHQAEFLAAIKKVTAR